MDQNYQVDIVADSISKNNKRITTFVLTYPRFTHSELMTHRVFSRNAMSSRAVPVERMIEYVNENPAMPIHWGMNQPGMQAAVENDAQIEINLDFLCEGLKYNVSREEGWLEARNFAVAVAEGFHKAGYHKQIVNRILEPFQLMRTVVTATEFDNWYWLRDHADAQPEIKRLAEMMLERQNASEPKLLDKNEWHTPFYKDGYWIGTDQDDKGEAVDEHGHTLKEALLISSSCCAQASFRKNDDSLEKAISIYNRLVEMEPPHYSPFEHQAKPMGYAYMQDVTELVNEEGATHIDKYGNVWSGNFKGWIQNRQLLHIKLNHKLMTVK